MFKPLHKHLIIKTFVSKVFTDTDKGKRMLTKLVKLVGMKPVTKAQCKNVTELGNEGPTGSINLATSHAAFHLWNETKLLMFDLYSCKDFNEYDVVNFLEVYFGKFTNPSIFILDRESMIMKEVRDVIYTR